MKYRPVTLFPCAGTGRSTGVRDSSGARGEIKDAAPLHRAIYTRGGPRSNREPPATAVGPVKTRRACSARP
jgi:hypothetical protein